MNARTKPSHQHAVVIGGSIAGLTTARALADHFEQVTVIERDLLPTEPEPRKAIPQGHHVHALLMRGLLVMESLFPGFQREMESLGVPFADPMADTKLMLPYGWGPRSHSGSRLMLVSRDFLEWGIRLRVKMMPSVTFVEGSRVQGLSHESGRVTGVRFIRGDAAVPEHLTADLVVDASGRSSQSPKWLTELGYEGPKETTVDARWGYASRFYRLRPGCEPDWSLALSLPNIVAETRGGVITVQEGNRVIHTIYGALGDYPPIDEEGFVAFSRSLVNHELSETIDGAEPLSDIHGYRLPANRLRHYERLRRRPECFVVLGDAVCVTNPLFGEGMTTAVMGAELLGKELRSRRGRRTLDGLAERFQKRLARQNRVPWMASTGSDYRCPGVVGDPQPAAARLVGHYAERLHILSYQDPEIATKMFEVQQLVRSPASLFSLPYIVKVMAGWRRLAPKVIPVEVRRSRPPLDVRRVPVAASPPKGRS